MTVNYYHCNLLRINELFTDAEVGEDGGEEGGGGDGAGYGAEVVKGLADVLGYEVGGQAGIHRAAGAAEGGGSRFQGGFVAGIGYYQFGIGVVVALHKSR